MPFLLGTLLVPLGFAAQRRRLPGTGTGANDRPSARARVLPLARRDVERLRQILGLQRRLRVISSPPRAQRALMHRGTFREA